MLHDLFPFPVLPKHFMCWSLVEFSGWQNASVVVYMKTVYMWNRHLCLSLLAFLSQKWKEKNEKGDQ